MALAIDGNVDVGLGSAHSSIVLPALSTSGTNRLIVVVAAVNGPAVVVSSVTSTSSLTFTLRATCGGDYPIEEWVAVAAAQLTNEVITVNYSAATTFSQANAFGISGGNTSTKYDSNGSLPATSTADANLSISTSNANTLIIGGFRIVNGVPNAPGGSWTVLSPGTTSYFLTFYQIASATQSGLTVPKGAGNTTNGALADAFIEAGAAVLDEDGEWIITTQSW